MSHSADHAALQAAAHWFARLHGASADAELQQRWADWLAEAPSHRAAWGYVENINARFGRVQGHSAQQVFGALQQQRQSRRQLLGSLGLLGVGTGLGWHAWQQGWVTAPAAWLASYRTGFAEIRAVTLEDGTQLWLNANSALDARFNGQQRNLQLYAGEVLIQTARDPRPLYLSTRAGHLHTQGARFSACAQGPITLLTVFEEMVQATCANSQASRRVSAGQALRFDTRHLHASQPAQAQRQHWQHGVLVADNTPLRQVLAELGHYRHGHLGMAPALEPLRVVGTFPLLDSDRALAMLERVLPVRCEQLLPWWVTLEPRANS